MDSKYNKTISAKESKFLELLNDEDKAWFNMEEAYSLLEGQTEGAVRFMLKRMVDKGLLTKFGKSLFWIVPFDADAVTYMPDWHLLAGALAGECSHYIGYYSALQIHSLITQPSLKEQIVSDTHKAQTLVLKGVEFQFIKHNEKHFFGVKKIWIDSYNKVLCSDLEKTIIDCLYMPDYAGGIVEVAKALWTAREKLEYAKLLQYAKRFGSQVVIKRLGYLLDNLGIDNSILDELLKERSAAVSPLDTEVPPEGRISTKWSILQNVDLETIKNAIEN